MHNDWQPDIDAEPAPEPATSCGACGVTFEPTYSMKSESPDMKGACRACAKELE